MAAFAPDDVLAKWQAGIRAADMDKNVIPMLEVIGEDFWTGGGVTTRRVSQRPPSGSLAGSAASMAVAARTSCERR